MYLFVNEDQFNKCKSALNVTQVNEPFHIVSLKFSIEDWSGLREERSVERLVRESDIDAMCKDVVAMYFDMWDEDPNVSITFLGWHYVVKDIASYGLAIVSSTPSKEATSVGTKLVQK